MSADLYDPGRIKSLFDEMAATYGAVNMISSFGFCIRWRAQCVRYATIAPGMTVCDLMTGMGECWSWIARRMNGSGRIIGVDFSPEMCARARKHVADIAPIAVEVLEEDALDCSIESASVDSVVSTFGLKTLSHDGQVQLAREVDRILKPGGTFSFVDISVPKSRLLQCPYMAYLDYAIPVIGRAFLGNPDNYRHLGIYTKSFSSSADCCDVFRNEGLDTHPIELFFGCASGFHGTKPA